MKKTFTVLTCAGIMFCAGAHPFVTNGATVIGDNETEVVLSWGTDFLKEGNRDFGFSLGYGIGDRFQIEMGSAHIKKKDGYYDWFETQDLSMILLIRDDLVAIKGHSTFNAEEFGALMLYMLKLQSQTEINLDLGFVTDDGGKERNAFSWAYSIVQPINNTFFGAEVYGKSAGFMEKDEKKPQWQVGLGQKVFKRKTHIVSLGFGGSFVSKDDLYMTLAMTYSCKILLKDKE